MVIQLLLTLQMQLFEVQMSKPQRPTALYNAWHVTVTSWTSSFILHLRQCLLKRNNYRNYLLSGKSNIAPLTIIATIELGDLLIYFLIERLTILYAGGYETYVS